jgi:hypothetical protein
MLFLINNAKKDNNGNTIVKGNNGHAVVIKEDKKDCRKRLDGAILCK